MVDAAMDAGTSSLSALLPSTAIRLDRDAADWRDAVRLAGAALVDSGTTDAAYTDEMIRTVEELGPYIVIAPGIALAHSRPSPAVRRPGLSLVTLRVPVPFGHEVNDPVRLVVGLASPDADGHVNALASLAGFLADDGLRERLLRATTPEEVRSLIEAYEKGAVETD